VVGEKIDDLAFAGRSNTFMHLESSRLPDFYILGQSRGLVDDMAKSSKVTSFKPLRTREIVSVQK
jgi:hypothetical protein